MHGSKHGVYDTIEICQHISLWGEQRVAELHHMRLTARGIDNEPSGRSVRWKWRHNVLSGAIMQVVQCRTASSFALLIAPGPLGAAAPGKGITLRSNSKAPK